MENSSRPLAPFFTYDLWRMSSSMSIAHRLCELVCSAACGLLAIWLGLLAFAPGVYAWLRDMAYSPFIVPFALGFLFFGSIGVFAYICTNIRYSLWECGFGFELPQIYATGWAAIAASLLMTTVFWVFILGF